MNDFNSILAMNIKLIRAKQNLTLNDLCDKTGVAVATLSKIENGKAKAQIQTIYKIASALNVSVDDLMKGKESKEND